MGTDYFEGGLTYINELGGEIVDLPIGTRIIPHDVSMEMAKNVVSKTSETQTVTQNINITIPGMVVREEADIDKISEALAFRVRQYSAGRGIPVGSF